MENKRLIALQHLCEVYKIEISFVYSLNEYGLIEIIESQGGEFVEEEHLADVEKLMRLHYDLEINLAGLDVIKHLLNRLNESQQDLLKLRNKLE